MLAINIQFKNSNNFMLNYNQMEVVKLLGQFNLNLTFNYLNKFIIR